MSPREDVCQLCEEMRGKVRVAASETAKERALSLFSDHLESAQLERDSYRDSIKLAKESWQLSQESGDPPGSCITRLILRRVYIFLTVSSGWSHILQVSSKSSNFWSMR